MSGTASSLVRYWGWCNWIISAWVPSVLFCPFLGGGLLSYCFCLDYSTVFLFCFFQREREIVGVLFFLTFLVLFPFAAFCCCSSLLLFYYSWGDETDKNINKSYLLFFFFIVFLLVFLLVAFILVAIFSRCCPYCSTTDGATETAKHFFFLLLLCYFLCYFSFSLSKSSLRTADVTKTTKNIIFCFTALSYRFTTISNNLQYLL